MSSPELPPKPEAKKRESESRREAILERIDSRVEVLLALDDVFSSVKPEETLEETKRKIAGFLTTVINKLTPEEIKKIDYLYKRRLVEDKAGRAMPFLENKGEIFKVLTEDEKEEILKSPESVEEDEMFVLDISSVTDNFINNRKSVLEFSDDRIRGDLGNLFPGSGIENYPFEIRRGRYDIQILLDGDMLSKIYNGGIYEHSTLYGFHRNNTPYSFVMKSDASREDESIRHEKVHTLLDGAQFLKSANPNNAIRSEYKFYNQFVPIAGKAEIFFRKRFSPERVMAMVHNEIIAALENLSNEEKWFSKVPTVSEKEERELSAHMFESASAQILEMVSFLDETYRTTFDDDELANLSKELAAGIKEMFVRVANIIRESRARAEKIGGDAPRRVHMLFHLLRPSQYRHIESYLDFKYPGT